MNVTMLDPATISAAPGHKMTEEQLYNEINCYRAGKLAEILFENGLVTEEEYERIIFEYRKAYTPYLSEIT